MDSEEIMQRLAGSEENDIYSFPLAKKFDNELKYREVTEYEDKVTLSKADYFKRIPAVAFLTIENKRLEGRLTNFSVKKDGSIRLSFSQASGIVVNFTIPVDAYRMFEDEKLQSCIIVLYSEKSNMGGYIELLRFETFKELEKSVEQAINNIYKIMFPNGVPDKQAMPMDHSFIETLLK